MLLLKWRDFRHIEMAAMNKFTPQEVKIIEKVYLALLDEDWFNRNTVTERELLKLICRAFRENYQTFELFEASCSEEARARFTRRVANSKND